MSQPTSSAVRSASSAAVGPYVINLCASMTPMALTRPTAPELARFTFFVSRRREEGRERFRLHMGYFQTREEAEQLLALIRDLYPAAWVGEAPGKRLAAREAGKGVNSASAVAATVDAVGKDTAGQSANAKPGDAKTADAKAPAGAPTARSSTTAAKAAARAAPHADRAAATPPAAPASAPRRAGAQVPPSNVREVIASLDTPSTTAASTAAPSAAPAAPVAAPPSAAGGAPVQRRAGARAAPVGASGAAARGAAAGSPDELSDSQVLRILETRRASATGQSASGARVAASDIRMLNPDDTQTWRDIRAQISRDAAVHFAVQLAWSVTPIDLERIPGLAIFNAYTLYKVEGNREGRRWYGLRLGFFSDAVAARQVALYVRSEFATVAVVPVSAKERLDAMQVGAIELPRRAPAASKAPAGDEIELIDEAVDAALSAQDRPAAGESAPQAAPTPEAPAASPEKPASPVRRSGRPRGTPQTLEETLEILGASQLSIDDGKGVRLDLGSSTGGTRRGARASARNTTFAKLLDRLTEKLRS